VLVPQVGHSGIVLDAAFNRDGSLAASIAADGQVRLWDVPTGALRGSVPGPDLAWRLAFHPTAPVVVVAGRVFLHAWNLATGTVTAVRGGSIQPTTFAISPDGRFAASGGVEPWVRVVDFADLSTGQLEAGDDAPAESVTSVAFTPDGRVLAVADEAGTIRMWDVVHRREIAEPAQAPAGSIGSLAFSPDGRVLAVAGGLLGFRDFEARAWRWAPPRSGDPVRDIAFSPDGRTLAAAANRIEMWDVAGATLLRAVDQPDVVPGRPAEPTRITQWDEATQQVQEITLEPSRGTTGAAYSPDGTTLLSWGWGDEGSIHVIDPESGALRGTLRGRTVSTEDLLFGPDGRTLAVVPRAGPVELWDVRSGALRAVIPEESKLATFSPDGTMLALPRGPGVAAVWDVERGALRATLTYEEGAAPGQDDHVFDLAFSGDGRMLVMGESDEVIAWDLATGAGRRLCTGRMNHLAAAPDGGSLLTWGYGRGEEAEARLWSLPDGALRAVLPWETSGADAGPLMLSGAAFSPDGRSLAWWVFGLGSGRDSLRVWDATTGRRGSALAAHAGLLGANAAGAAFSPDGRLLASWGARGFPDRADEIKLWSLAAGEAIATMDHDGERIHGVAFAADGKLLFSLGEEGSRRVWYVPSGAPYDEPLDGPPAIHVPEPSWSPGGFAATGVHGAPALVRLADGATVMLDALDVEGRRVDFVHTPQGVWDGDDKGAVSRQIVYRLGRRLDSADLLTHDQLGDAFYHPGLLRDFFAGRSVDPPPSVAQGVGPPPGVEIVAAPGGVVDADRAQVCIRAVDRGGGLAGVWMTTPGGATLDPLPAGPGAAGPNGCAEPGEYFFEVPIEEGENAVAAQAKNAAGGILGSPVPATVLGAPGRGPVRLHLLTVSVSRYTGDWTSLPYADDDADALVEALRRQTGLYETVVAEQLKDAEVTREAVRRVAGGMAADVRPRDVFVLFVSGHATVLPVEPAGGDRRGGYWFVTSPGRPADAPGPSDPRDEWLSFEDLASVFRAVHASKEILLLDTCHAGAAATEDMLRDMGADREWRETEERRRLRELGRARGVSVFAASAPDEPSYDSARLGHGFFTQALLDALGGGGAEAGGADGRISTRELEDYLRRRVGELMAQQDVQAVQTLWTRTAGDEYDLAGAAQ
jgi:WD40 repeat protein